MIFYQDCSSHLYSSKNTAARGRGLFSLYIYIVNFKNLLVRNHWTDFDIILQKCSFGDPLPRCSSHLDLSKNMAARGRGLFSLHYEKMPIQIYWKFYHRRNWKFLDKNSDIFHISAQNIDCGYSLEPPRRGGYNEYPQSMFLSGKKKNNVYPCKPQFCYIKVGFKGGQNYIGVFSWCISLWKTVKIFLSEFTGPISI